MSSHFLTDKSLSLESRFGGWAFARRRAFGEPGVVPHYGPDRNYRIAHSHLKLTIDPVARTLVGEARLSFELLVSASGTLSLDLDELTVDAVTDAAGTPVPYTHRDGKLEVPAIAEVVVRYHGQPRRGLYFVGPAPDAPGRPPEAWTQGQDEDAHFVFPCFDHPSMLQRFTLEVVAPEGYTVVSNGRLRSQVGGTWIWDQGEPIAAYLVTVVVMRAEVVEDDTGPVPVRFVVPAGTPEAVSRRVFGKTAAMIRSLSARYGAYPWPRYDQVVVHEFVFGGMENVAATTLTDLVLTDDETARDWDAESLIVHELAHQWFGDLLTCQDWSQGWLNEGWATYTEYIWALEDKGVDDASFELFDQLGAYLSEDGGRYRRPIVSYLFREPIDLFDRHLYEKAALVLHTLRETLGEGPFWAGVGIYLARHRHQPVHTRHFQRAMEDGCGRNLDCFFDQWILGPGHPVVEVNASWAAGQLTVAVKQTQEGDGVCPAFRFPLRVHVDGVERVLQVEERERAFVLACPVEPTRLRIDGDFRVLAELTLKTPRSMLLVMLREDPGVVGRIRAARALAEEGSPEAVAALVDRLRSDPFWGVRAEIADLLGTRGGDVAIAALLGAVGDPEPKARRRMFAALGSVRRTEVGDVLAALPDDVSVQVRGERVRSLGRLRHPSARAAADACLGEDSWGDLLRARSLEALGHLRDLAVLPTLLAYTADHVSARGRAAACGALARLADEVEAARTPVVERLVILAEHENFRVQVAAINALGVVRDPRALGVLTRVHASAGDGRCRRLAYEAMADIRDGRSSEEGLQGLRRQLESLADDNRKLRDRVGRLEPR